MTTPEFNATAVAQAFFDGAKPILWEKDGEQSHCGDYSLGRYTTAYVEPNDEWITSDYHFTFISGVAFALAERGEIVPESASRENVKVVARELRRLIWMDQHPDGPDAGLAEFNEDDKHRIASEERARNAQEAEQPTQQPNRSLSRSRRQLS